ncbi:Glycosyl transferase family 90 [Pseudooceanicola antarcticus]|uniref:3-hydroxybutyryl-CoA dehydrogenase n=1 Tax=Pseudooceanicola antarcticus TaxID=1247613 RepID=A0A285HSJ5_9RHOB|nr:3-hydroxybutyryl-CoA dehydrogenase [Pseudooceanicola antarcticus]SNY37796.1 Glycosyl transferase family 90 [Pseudooceanicola antarcticus]
MDLSRPGYFSAALWRKSLPVASFTRKLDALLPESLDTLPEALRQRIDWCCKLDAGRALPSTRLGDMKMEKRQEFYFLDLMRHAKGFGWDMRLDWRFGDVTEVPEVPALLKSRPIGEDNANSVVMPLDYLRHFKFPDDPVPLAEKRPLAVFRGRLGSVQAQPARYAAVMQLHDHPRHDVGQVNTREDLPPAKGWMTIPDQLRYRYILAPEGNDVATSLKWIMNSNSIAVTPPLEYETWFMEGRLVPGEHFIGVKPDYSDLDEKIDWAESHPEEAARINRNAKAWCAQFHDRQTENLVAALVLQKYIEATGGLAHSRIQRNLFFPAG